MTLEADIARIARSRGVDPANYLSRPARRVQPHHVQAIFNMASPEGHWDLKAYDRLPDLSRLYLRSCLMPLNAIAWRDALADVGSEDALIAAVQSHLPGFVGWWVQRHYGADHPSLRRLM